MVLSGQYCVCSSGIRQNKVPCSAAPCTSCVPGCSTGLYPFLYIATYRLQLQTASLATSPARVAPPPPTPSHPAQPAPLNLSVPPPRALSARPVSLAALPAPLPANPPVSAAPTAIFYTPPTTPVC